MIHYDNSRLKKFEETSAALKADTAMERVAWRASSGFWFVYVSLVCVGIFSGAASKIMPAILFIVASVLWTAWVGVEHYFWKRRLKSQTAYYEADRELSVYNNEKLMEILAEKVLSTANESEEFRTIN